MIIVIKTYGLTLNKKNKNFYKKKILKKIKGGVSLKMLKFVKF